MNRVVTEGTTFGKYRIVRLLATGGMGEVCLAQLVGPAGYVKTLVIKRLLRHLAAEPNVVELFLNEARLAALLDHPNIVQIFELGETDGSYFIAMEYVRGCSVAQLLRRSLHGLPPELAALVCEQALLGLAYVHGRADDQGQPLRLVHRDVSPDNLLVSYDGVVKLTDFGIARVAAQAKTTGGVVRGKYRYMPPEQLRGEPVDETADLYAMGVVLYELACGSHPFPTAGNELALIRDVQELDPVPLRVVRSELPPALEAICMRAMSKRPSERFTSARDMADSLTQARREWGEVSATRLGALVADAVGSDAPVEAFTRAEGVSSQPPSQGSGAVAPARARRLLLHGALLTTFLVAVVMAFRWSRGTRDPVTPAIVAPSAPPPLAPAPEPQPEPTRTSAPEAKRPPSVESATRTGHVVFQIYPWAEVSLGSKRFGPTPLEPITLQSGTHVFTLRNPELGIESTATVRVPPGGTAVVKRDLLRESGRQR